MGGAPSRVASLAECPFIDDWTYAWSVEHLLRAGELRFLDWSVSQNVAQVLWGALFCAPFGFSFTALRLSTWAASLGALLGLYALLRELGVSRPDILVGVALVGFYPVYFILSFSFMTDVPFVTMVTWWFAALVRALKRPSSLALGAAVVFACLAVAIRPVGVFLSGVLLLAPWPPASRWRSPLRRLAVAAAPVVAATVLMLARPGLTAYRADLTGIPGLWPWREMVNLNFGPAQLAAWLAMNLTFVSGTVGTALAPLALGSLSRENARTAPPGGLLAALVFTGELLLRRGGGSAGSGVHLEPPRAGDDRAARSAVDDGAGSVSGMGSHGDVRGDAVAGGGVGAGPSPKTARPGEQPRVGGPGLLRVEHCAVAVLRSIRAAPRRDRRRTARRHGGIPRLRLALVGVVMFITMQYSHALWHAVAWARQAGIEDRQLDGGYVVNGWLQYAHPEHAARGPSGDVQVPGVNGGEPPRYGIVKRVPPDSRVLHVVHYRRIIAPSGSIYVIDWTPALEPRDLGGNPHGVPASSTFSLRSPPGELDAIRTGSS